MNLFDSAAAWKTVQILIRWLRQKPADLNLHCFLQRIHPGSARQMIKHDNVIIKF